jgi:hypothetical protein
MIIAYPFRVRNSTVTSGDNRMPGLTFTIAQCKTLANPPIAITGAALPTVVEVGEGEYFVLYDAEANGEALVQLDAGSSLSNPSDRYIDVPMTRDSSRIQTGFSATGQLTPAALDTILVEVQTTVGGVTTGETLNLRQALQVVTARLAGSLAGANQNGGTITVSAAGSTSTRLTFTADPFGNVSGVVLTPTA